MEGFIDRLADLLKSLFGSDDEESSRARASRGPGVDPDLQAAWEELNEYINTGRKSTEGGTRAGRRGRPSPPEYLRQDYANLEVPFGSDMDEVRKAYKRLMLKYHPDRHAGDPEAQRMALEIAKKINQSFERIRSHQEG